MAKLRIFTVLALLFGVLGTVNAQTLDMEGVASGSDGARPSSGMTADSVESTFGAPEAKVAPVGDPPIARWEYKDFVVFFEYDRVIHTVVKRQVSS
ncbi:MAG: hypothetical protein GQ577_12470 [Woeseiaceae bacterium]|nr:hypothetical protein [Woeseiaceae bacterium]